MRTSGRAEQDGHPGQWIEANGEQAARRLAVQGELDARRARTIALTAERAVADAPPGRVRETIGDPPELGLPERAYAGSLSVSAWNANVTSTRA